MQRKPVWVIVAISGLLFAAPAPHRALAQQTKEAPAEVPAKFEPGRLGAELRALSGQSIKALGLSQAHALLVVVAFSDGPADRAGLKPGDVIVELDGAAVGPLQEVIAAIQRRGAGRGMTLGIQRATERLAIPATLGKPADSGDATGPAD